MIKQKSAHSPIVAIAVLALLLFSCGKVWARPATAYQAEQVVTGWLKADSQPLGTSLGRHVASVETFAGQDGQPIYYVVYLESSGFVIVPADDVIEPVVGFSDDRTFDRSPENPLGALVAQDLNERVATARANRGAQSQLSALAVSDTQSKWAYFINLAEASNGKLSSMGVPSISDTRVAPLVQTKWNQYEVCGEDCYNYYTPNNYYCGCVATAMAQLMRYHEYPAIGIGVQEFIIEVEEHSQTAYTRGGDGQGGPYHWNDMVLVPDCSTPDLQRRAIAALCYDAGVAVNTSYGPDGSSAGTLKAADALTTTFKYSNAVKGYNNGDNIGSGLLGMINPNLDSGNPVILGIWREAGGHAILCDGYGYNASTLYHHLNMGWSGDDDAWYNLPNVDAQPAYRSVLACMYNISTSGTGEIISGRVTDESSGPIAGATVTAEGQGGPHTAYTNVNGIYALADVRSASTYAISVIKDSYMFADRTVSTGTSSDQRRTSGNRWAVNFAGMMAGDYDGDGDVDAVDFAVFAWSWFSEPANAAWNPYCDMSSPADSLIDQADLAVFAENWLAGLE
jgi:hypothetical protein